MYKQQFMNQAVSGHKPLGPSWGESKGELFWVDSEADGSQLLKSEWLPHLDQHTEKLKAT